MGNREKTEPVMGKEHQPHLLQFSFMPRGLWIGMGIASVGCTRGGSGDYGVRVLSAKDFGKVSWHELCSPICEMGTAISTLNVVFIWFLAPS